jgi:hypothetical protein
LDQTHGGVARAIEECNARMIVVGDPENVGRILNLNPPPAGTGMIPHPRYPLEMARLDVAIVPLATNVYTQAKSWITPLTCSALGVPWVGSPSPEYELFYQGLTRATKTPPAALARAKGREWRREVIKALRMPENEREEAMAATKQYIQEHHVIETQAWKRGEVWEEVANG